MLKTVRVSEASWRVMKEHSKDLKVWREELRTIAGSRTRKAEPPPEISGDLEEGVIRAGSGGPRTPRYTPSGPGPYFSNGRPLALRSLPRVFSQKFLQQLKTTLFGSAGVGSASE